MPHHISIGPLGAQVLSASISDHELLYFSPLSQVNRPARGGVPVIFPQFAEHGPLIKHGFARNLLWNFVDERCLPDSYEKNILLLLHQKLF
jgi:D-hexose-6-phosphate mutarotase